MEESIRRRRDVAEHSLIGNVGAGSIRYYIEGGQDGIPIGGDTKQALALTARFRADEIG